MEEIEINEELLKLNKNELINKLVLNKLENKQLNNLIINLKTIHLNEINELKQTLTNELKKNVRIENELIQINDNYNILINKYNDILKENEILSNKLNDNKTILNDFKTKYYEKYNYVQILEKKINEENEISIKKSLETTIYNQETIISTLEEKVQILENDLRLMIQKHSKEIEQIKVDKMDIWIQLQEANEKVEVLQNECNEYKIFKYQTIEQQNLTLNTIKLLNEEIVILKNNLQNQTNENNEMKGYIIKLKKDIDILKREYQEQLRVHQITRSELKVSERKYEKLEKLYHELQEENNNIKNR